MSGRTRGSLLLLGLLLLGVGLCWWAQDTPRREPLAALTRLDLALQSGDRAELLELMVIPEALRDRTSAEQSEFLAKALQDEISADGLAVLQSRAAYGPLAKMFPAEADAWCATSGVDPDDCVAFKLERNGTRAEVVMVREDSADLEASTPTQRYRVVRLNNVKQMAHITSFPTPGETP